MSGLLALLDDVAALTKLAAAQLDDVAKQVAKAGSKAAGVVIDDGAVTPKYLNGLPAARELPIVWQIARGSLFNKLIILLPAAVFLNAFLPWLLTPLLMIGGTYLCFEGAEKVWHMLKPHQIDHHAAEPVDPEHLERERVAGAIKTDFILSAEIMVIALSTIDSGSIWRTAVVLAVVAIAITALVYGTVALLVKADDIGLKMSLTSRVAAFRALGRGIVKAMPGVLTTIGLVGTAAMLWVGGSIVIHGLEEMGAGGLGHMIHDIEAAATRLAPVANGFVGWLVKAILDGIFGLALGLAVIPVATHVLAPLSARMTAQKPS